MDPENKLSQIKEAMEEIVEALSTGDISEVDSIFAPNYIDHQKPPNIDVGGPEEFKQIVDLARTHLPNLKVEIKDLIAEANKVVTRLLWISTDSSGKRKERETIEIMHFVNGKAIEHWGAEVEDESR